MNVLIDISHPGHVHLFRHTAAQLERDGHHVYYTIRDIPVIRRLMDSYGLPYVILGRKRKSIVGKALSVVMQDIRMMEFVIRHRIDLGLSSGIVLSHVSRLVPGMKSFIVDDDDDSVEPLVVRYGHPFADAVITPDSIHRQTPKAVYYAGTHELAYLHPQRFTPDTGVLEELGVRPDEKYFIVRFVAFMGHHDVHQHGLDIAQKGRLIALLERYGRVFITSEKPVEPEFEKYRVPVSPEKMHSVMAFASMFLGDSQTMTSEAAVLGVPALKCNTFAGRLSVPNELQEHYALCYAYLPEQFEEYLSHVERLLSATDTAERWSEKRKALLSEKIDVSAFLTWFIENYPQSRDRMQSDSDCQYVFR